MSRNSEKDSITYKTITIIIKALSIATISTVSLGLFGKIISSIIFIMILLLMCTFIKMNSLNKIDMKSYESIRKDLDDIGRILEDIRINHNNISVESIEAISDFVEYYYNSAEITFSNLWVKIKFKSLCKTLMKLQGFIWDNHLNNANGVTIRVSFIGSSSGEYDRNKHEKEEENKAIYPKLLNKAVDDYRSFRKYCENRL
ncbi:hypothetical protein ACYO9G_00020 [Staphylococcus aureus]